MQNADTEKGFLQKYRALNDENNITKQLSREVVLDILYEKLKTNPSATIKTIDADLEKLVNTKLASEQLPAESVTKIKEQLGNPINFLSLLPDSNASDEEVREFYSKPTVLNNVKEIIGKINQANVDSNPALCGAIGVAIEKGGMRDADLKIFQNLRDFQRSKKQEKIDPVSNFFNFVDVLAKALEGVLNPPNTSTKNRHNPGSEEKKSENFVDEIINLCCPTKRRGK